MRIRPFYCMPSQFPRTPQVQNSEQRASEESLNMCSLRGPLTSTSRPWRPVYAYACYCLLPLSLALRPAFRNTFNGPPPASATRSRASDARWSTSGRLGWHHGSPSASALRVAPTSSSSDPSARRLRTRSDCTRLASGFLGGASLLSVDCARSFSSKRGARRGAGRALAMGKGLDRKKAKKSQVNYVNMDEKFHGNCSSMSAVCCIGYL